MTTWITFETIDETERFTEFFIDRLGVHQYLSDERTRFHLIRIGDQWQATDYEHELNELSGSWAHRGSMRDVIHWVAGRILYGA